MLIEERKNSKNETPFILENKKRQTASPSAPQEASLGGTEIREA